MAGVSKGSLKNPLPSLAPGTEGGVAFSPSPQGRASRPNLFGRAGVGLPTYPREYAKLGDPTPVFPQTKSRVRLVPPPAQREAPVRFPFTGN